ncbi:MAG: LysE family translocator [Pseudomonadota bacterium]
MSALAILPVFIPAAFIVAMSPGASNLLAFVNGTQAGLGRAVAALIGRLAAFFLMVLAVAAGLGAVLETSEIAFTLIKWAGIAYLLYLGWQAWTAPVPEAPPPAPPRRHLMRREFTTALTNPKAMLLFTAFLPQFVAPETSASAQLLVLGTVYLAVEFTAASLYAATGALLGARALSQARRRLMNRISALAMVGAAGLLARAERAA